MKKRVGLNSVVSTGVLLGSLGVGLGFNSARAEPIHSPVLSLEDSLKVI